MRFLTALSLLLLPLLFSFSLGDLAITTPQGLIDFAVKVNGGTSYSDETVYLGADLDFTPDLSSNFVPIGKTSKYTFKGTFDGQGHTISNLAISSSSNHTGLFGASSGATIKNIVIDSTCSVVCTHSTSLNVDVGSIVGYCYSGTIMNNVNMASVTFSGSVSNAKIGGIVARVLSPATIKNCANYGSVTYSGSTESSISSIDIGGIVGTTASSSTKYINNCLNYGAITHSGTTTAGNLYMGGILGESYYGTTNINNCVSAGKLAKTTSAGVNNYIGTIVGLVSGSSTLNVDHSVWTSDVGYSASYGYRKGTTSVSSDSTLITPSATEVSKLNTQASSNSWNGWVLNTNSNKITFKINNNKDFSFSSKIILLPDLNGTESNPFSGWYTDSACTNSFTSQSVPSATILYGLYGNIVSVTLDGNGGTPSQQIVHVQPNKVYGTLMSVERDGYTFVGWFTEKDEGKGEEVTENVIVSTENVHTLYAHWEINNYTLTFIFNNSESDEVRTLNYSDSIVYPEDPVREGYTFSGWDNKGITTMPAHNLNFTAQWVINNYTITFIFNNGTEPEVRILDFSDIIEYPENVKRKGYTFNGWDNKDTTTMPAHNLNITAQWTPNNYTITFNATEGDVSEYEKNVTYDDVYGELATTTRTGYDFDGWFSAVTGGTQYTKDSTVKITADLTLYARWIPNNYTVYLNANGGSNTTASWKVIYGSEYGDLPIPSREGHTFTGWFTETPGGSLVNFSTVVSFAYDHTIYAHWEIIQYTISFVSNGGSECDNITQDYGSFISFLEMSKTGYAFVCWCSDPSLTIEYTAKRVESRNITLYAKWEANNYTVLLDSKGGGSVNSMVVTYEKNYGSLPTPTKSESEFLWWEINGTGQRVWNYTVVETAHNHTLCAVWNVNEVSFFDSDGTCDLVSVDVTYGKNYSNLTNATRTGYTFVGWFFNESSTEPVTNDTNVTIPYPHTLYARWRINSYTVTFDPDNGENAIAKMFEYNNTVTYPKDPERRGYTFSGWNNNTLDFMPSENITVTAKWTPNNYTVTFNVNRGGALVVDEIKVTFNTLYGALPTPSRTGHTFAGWTDSLFGGNEVNSSTTVSVPNNHTLYALWTVNQYTVTFVSDGMKPISIILNYNDRIVYPNENPSKSFHKFRRWCTRGDSGEEECNVTHVPDHNLTFTASFDVDSSLVTGITAVCAFSVALLIILLIIIVFLIRVTRTVKHKYEDVDIEMEEDTNARKEDIEKRIRQQVKSTRISVDIKKKLENPLKKADKNKGVEETLMDLEVDCENADDIDIINSYRTTNASAAVANAINNEKNLVAAAEYLALLYTSVREQEEYEKFSELYFSMKDVDDFINNMDEKTTSFGGIISGFTSKKVAIQSLISKEGEASMPSGILFRVQNGMGYNIGKVEEDTNEVLFELCSSFKVESMKEIIRDKYIVVNLSFVSPMTKSEMIKLK